MTDRKRDPSSLSSSSSGFSPLGEPVALDAQRFRVFEATPLSEPRLHPGKHRMECEMVRAFDYDRLVAEVTRLRSAVQPEPIKTFLESMAAFHPECDDETLVGIGYWMPWVHGAGARFNSQLRLTLGELKRLRSAVPAKESETERPLFWQHMTAELNEAHQALDRLGAPKTREVLNREGTAKQSITIGLRERISALRSAVTEPPPEKP